jgi:hypothetical protein
VIACLSVCWFNSVTDFRWMMGPRSGVAAGAEVAEVEVAVEAVDVVAVRKR